MSDSAENILPQETKEKPVITRKAKHPGRLISQATLLLHTRHAQRLFRGHFHQIPGVMAFSRQLMKIWQAASEDDPYADWYLIKTYDVLHQTRKKLETGQQEYQALFTRQDNLRLELGTSSKPIEFSLQFGTPYGYMASYLIADYDRLARQFLSARALGLVDGYFTKSLEKATELVKHVLEKPMDWIPTGITRENILENNQRVQEIAEQLGQVPKQIVTGKLRAPYAPAIQKKKLHE